MEPTSLTCPKCAAQWKVIKAGDGPITCPNCKAVVGGPTPQPAAPAPPPAAAAPRPPAEVSDADDPGLAGPVRRRAPAPTPVRRGRNPLVTVAVVCLVVLLIPVALSVCLFAVCAASFG